MVLWCHSRVFIVTLEIFIEAVNFCESHVTVSGKTMNTVKHTVKNLRGTLLTTLPTMILGLYTLFVHGQSISGSWDTLTGGCSVHVPIRVLSQDGQSISGSQDTLTGGCSVLMSIHVLARDSQSILGYSGKEGWCDLAQCMYILRMVRHHWTCVSPTCACFHQTMWNSTRMGPCTLHPPCQSIPRFRDTLTIPGQYIRIL